MTRQQARRLIKELQSELRPTKVVEQFWMDKVQAYVKLIFGDEKESIALHMFDTYYHDRYYEDKTKDHSERALETVKKLQELFETYQKMISNSVFVKKNFLSNDTNGTIAGYLIFFAGLLGTAAFTLGKCTSDVQNYKLRDEVRLLQDSLVNVKLINPTENKTR